MFEEEEEKKGKKGNHLLFVQILPFSRHQYEFVHSTHLTEIYCFCNPIDEFPCIGDLRGKPWILKVEQHQADDHESLSIPSRTTKNVLMSDEVGVRESLNL